MSNQLFEGPGDGVKTWERPFKLTDTDQITQLFRIDLDGNTYVAGNLQVDGTVGAVSDVNVTGSVDVTNNLTVHGDLTFDGTLAGNVPLTGTAGGDLSGSYPNPTVAHLGSISGASLTNLNPANISAGTAAINISGNAATATTATTATTASTVTTNANLTGNVTSVGNATTIASIPAVSGAALTNLTAANISTGSFASGSYKFPGTLAVGTNSPSAAATLDVSSTTGVFVPPRMTSTQRDAISSPPSGSLIYNTTTGQIEVYI